MEDDQDREMWFISTQNMFELLANILIGNRSVLSADLDSFDVHGMYNITLHSIII